MIDENNVSETRESLEEFTESQPNENIADNKIDKLRGERLHAAREKLADDFFALLALSRRTLKIFLLDKAAVLFSLLAPLILLLLYTLFLGDVQIAAVKSGLPGGVELSDAAIKAFIDSWVAAGVMSVGAVSPFRCRLTPSWCRIANAGLRATRSLRPSVAGWSRSVISFIISRSRCLSARWFMPCALFTSR